MRDSDKDVENSKPRSSHKESQQIILVYINRVHDREFRETQFLF